MPNTKAPYGFRSSRPDVGGASGRTRRNQVANSYGTALAMGDPVALSAGYIVQAATGDTVVGVAGEFNYIPSAQGRPQFSRTLDASTSSAGLFEGFNTPTCIYEEAAGNSFQIQADGSVSVTDIGKYASVSIGAATANGTSTTVLKVSTITTVPVSSGVKQAMVRILQYVERVDNTPTDAYPDLEVQFVNTIMNQS